MYQIYEPRYSMQDAKWGDIALPGDKVQYNIQTNNGVCVCDSGRMDALINGKKVIYVIAQLKAFAKYHCT